MSRRRRRNTNKNKDQSTESSSVEVTPVASEETDQQININLDPAEEESTSTLTPAPERRTIDMAKNSAQPTTPETEYEVDIFLDEEPEVTATEDENVATITNSDDALLEELHTLATTTGGDHPATAIEDEEQDRETQAMLGTDLHLQQAKAGMAWSAKTMLTQTPEMATALQLNKVGDAVTITVTANGVTYEVTWKVAASVTTDEPKVREPSVTAPTITAATSALRDASPLSVSLLKTPFSSSMKCKFGRACNKGALCSYDHAIKPKLCSYVNTAQGCSSGAKCEFSHENEGMKCTRSILRYSCPNGRGCAFSHADDWIKEAQPAKPVQASKSANSIKTEPEEQTYDGTDATPPVDAPTGPKAERDSAIETVSTPKTAVATEKQVSVPPAGPKHDSIPQVTGQKRAREGNEEGGKVAQRPRSTRDSNATSTFRGKRQPRGRGRGASQGIGRGGGFRGRGGMGLNIRGAATRGIQ